MLLLSSWKVLRLVTMTALGKIRYLMLTSESWPGCNQDLETCGQLGTRQKFI